MNWLIVLLLVLVALAVVPTWPYSRSWGYGPSGLLGVLAIVLVVLLALKVF